MMLGLSKNVTAPVLGPSKYTVFGGSDTHPYTFLKSPSNLGLYRLLNAAIHLFSVSVA